MASAVKKRNFIERKIDWLDHFQQKSLFSFPYAVLKKHGDDEAGYQAALIAYYGFLSIFPLLIVGTGIVQILSQNDPTLREKFLQNTTSYFPAIGNTLADSIKTPSKRTAMCIPMCIIGAVGKTKMFAVSSHLCENTN
jgi:uncharacterized BrkB/YihY/UPF0761 family membrane protein